MLKCAAQESIDDKLHNCERVKVTVVSSPLRSPLVKVPSIFENK